MERLGKVLFGALLLLSAIAPVQATPAAAAAAASQWSATELADRTVERRAVEAIF